MALLSFAMAAALLAPAGAEANYSVVECQGSGVYADAPDAFLVAGGSYSIWGKYECVGPGSGWGLLLEGGPGVTARNAWLAWQVNAAPGTRFDTATTLVHYGTFGGYGPMVTSDGSPGYGGLSDGNGPDQWAWAPQTDANWYAVLMECFRSPGCGDDRAYVHVTSFTAEVEDLVPPQVTAGGDLLDGQVARGVEELEVSASDLGGGVRSISVHVNGVLSQSRDLCPPPGPLGYDRVKPCPASSGTEAFQLDSQNDPGWADGPNALRVCATDVGGNIAASCFQRTVIVDNSCPGSGGTTGASTLDGGVEARGGQLQKTVRISSNASPVVRGSLRDGAGRPVDGATVCLYETVDLPDGSRQLTETATTQVNGRFAMRLDPGPSRELDLVYRYNDRILTERLAIEARVVPVFQVPTKSLRNGQSARFRGRVPGPNAEARVITLQARTGRKWRTFKVLRTNSSGVYRGRYPFRSTVGRVRYVFRALVKRQGGYPYEPGSSRVRKILVSG
jgi:hypothetical protein